MCAGIWRSGQNDIGAQFADAVELRLVFFCLDGDQGVDILKITEDVNTASEIFGRIEKRDPFVGTFGSGKLMVSPGQS